MKYKRYRAVLLAAVMAAALCACGTGTKDDESTPEKTEVQQTYEVDITESQEGAF